MVDLEQYLPILIFLIFAAGLSALFVFLPMGVSRLTGAHKPDAEKLTVTLNRLRNDCDPCLFVRRGAKPTQEVYDKCTYQTWSTNARQHEVVVEGLQVAV